MKSMSGATLQIEEAKMYIDTNKHSDPIDHFPRNTKHLPSEVVMDELATLGKVSAHDLPACEPFTATEPFPLSGEVFEDECPACGEDVDEEMCTKCSYGHEDCDPRDCFICFEIAMAKAEDMADMDR